MGCDIHGCIEVNTQYDCWWKMVDLDVLMYRNYTFFGLFFGVRCQIKDPLFAYRGLPENASYSIKVEASHPDFHSTSWWDLQDYKKIDWDKQVCSDEGEPLADDDGLGMMRIKDATPKYVHQIKKMMDYLINNFDFKDARCIVWFDN